jgi:hypothetical protein
VQVVQAAGVGLFVCLAARASELYISTVFVVPLRFIYSPDRGVFSQFRQQKMLNNLKTIWARL